MPIFDSGLEALRKKYGPFSGWTWGTIGAAGIGAYLLFFHKSRPKTAATVGPGDPLGYTPTGVNGPGGGVSSPPPPPTTAPTPPVDTYVNPNPQPTPPVVNVTGAGNYLINTPGGAKVTATPEALDHPQALKGFLTNADINKSITDNLNPHLSENAQYAEVLRQQVHAGVLTLNDNTSYGNNQHGTVQDAITFYEQADGGSSNPISAPNNTGSPASAGASQGYNF